MKLWLISQTENRGYDTYDSAVVAAESADEAILIHPDGRRWDPMLGWSLPAPKGHRHPDYTWVSPPCVDVKLIGDAAPGISGVVLASFNAG